MSKIEIGTQIYYYPSGLKSSRTIPQVGFVQQVWSGGVCDIAIIPNQDGAITCKEHVPKMGDPRLKNHLGQASPLAEERGAWEPMNPDEEAVEAPKKTTSKKAS